MMCSRVSACTSGSTHLLSCSHAALHDVWWERVCSQDTRKINGQTCPRREPSLATEIYLLVL